MKFISWNVNGIRASVKKDFIAKFRDIDADFFCLQETKAQDDQVKEALEEITDYKLFGCSAERKGYSGTAILSKHEPLSFEYEIGIEEHSKEGRVTTIEMEEFYLINVYVPNSGSGLKRLEYRAEWDKAFAAYLGVLQEKKPIIVTGDLNVAHQAIDLARPKENYNKTSGYTQTEIDGLNRILDLGLVDTYRALNDDQVQYTFWNQRFRARDRNVGWRIDYFFVSEALQSRVTRAEIHDQLMGSDHCPILLEIS